MKNLDERKRVYGLWKAGKKLYFKGQQITAIKFGVMCGDVSTMSILTVKCVGGTTEVINPMWEQVSEQKAYKAPVYAKVESLYLS